MSRPSRTLEALVLAFALTLLVSVTGCGTKNHQAAANNVATGKLTVFAASSLSEAFNDIKTVMQQTNPDIQITYNFGNSSALVSQIEHGAPADVVATADTASMQQLTNADEVEPSKVFAENQLQIMVTPGNPKHVQSLADLARTDIKLVLADPSVALGRYTAEAFKNANVTPKPVSNETSAAAVSSKLLSGDADAVVVYTTDVKAAGDKAQGVEIAAAYNVTAQYPAAVVKNASNSKAGTAFIDYLLSPNGQAILYSHGFLPVTSPHG